jgi:ferritin-like metal-binding protein YciE
MQARDVIIRYLQDAEAAERNFEDALATFAKAGNQREVQQFFERCTQVAKTQHERLEDRLRALGSSPSTGKSMLAHSLGMAPTVAQLGHDPSE